jgi:hypothetical protein
MELNLFDEFSDVKHIHKAPEEEQFEKLLLQQLPNFCGQVVVCTNQERALRSTRFGVQPAFWPCAFSKEENIITDFSSIERVCLEALEIQNILVATIKNWNPVLRAEIFGNLSLPFVLQDVVHQYVVRRILPAPILVVWDLPGLSPQLLTFCVSVRSEYSRPYHLWPYSQKRWTKWVEKNKFRKREFFPESVSVEHYENQVRQLGGQLPSVNEFLGL